VVICYQYACVPHHAPVVSFCSHTGPDSTANL